jgi:hypothetical protein
MQQELKPEELNLISVRVCTRICPGRESQKMCETITVYPIIHQRETTGENRMAFARVSWKYHADESQESRLTARLQSLAFVPTSEGLPRSQAMAPTHLFYAVEKRVREGLIL